MQRVMATADRTAAPTPEELLLACARFTRTASRLNRAADPSAVWRAMATLEEAGPLRVSEFAELDHCSQPTATTMIKRLETGGLVDRVADPDDGRAWLVQLTDAGRKRLATMRAQTARQIRQRLGDDLPVGADQLRTAIEVITTMTAHLTGTGDRDDVDLITRTQAGSRVHEEDSSE